MTYDDLRDEFKEFQDLYSLNKKNWSQLFSGKIKLYFMAKAKKTEPKKPRADKDDEKLAVKGSFADISRVIKKNKGDKKKAARNDLEDEAELGGEG